MKANKDYKFNQTAWKLSSFFCIINCLSAVKHQRLLVEIVSIILGDKSRAVKEMFNAWYLWDGRLCHHLWGWG